MDAIRSQTNGLLEQFNDSFQNSRKEMIDRFLQDQQNLNKKFQEYALNSDDEDDSLDRENAHGGITAENLRLNFGNKNRNLDDDQVSITSVMTQCSILSDTDESSPKTDNKNGTKNKSRKKETGQKARVKESTNKTFEAETESRPQSACKSREEMCQKLSLSTPRFGVPERKSSSFERSKSLRVPTKTPLSTPVSSHLSQPPNSPEELRRNNLHQGQSKPSLQNIRTGSLKHSQNGNHAKQEKPKKLLTKRTVRPNTAMGLQSKESMSLVPEPDPVQQVQQERLTHPSLSSNLGWDGDNGRKSNTVRSAPHPIRNRIVSWEHEQSTEVANPFSSRRNSLGKSRVPPLPMSLSSTNDNSNPIYAPSYENSSKKLTKVSRSKSINHKPLLKSNSDYFPISQLEINGGNRMEYERMNDVDQSHTNSPLKRDTGSIRRYKGHSNLNMGEGSRGAQLAVLKLPPVSKKAHPDIPSRSSTSMGYFNKEPPMMKMMPVHIGEEF